MSLTADHFQIMPPDSGKWFGLRKPNYKRLSGRGKMTAHNKSDTRSHDLENRIEDHDTPRHSDFSIDHILNRAGRSTSRNESAGEKNSEMVRYQWLQCSRYCPPKIPRIPKRDVQKRQLGRHPRIPFTSYQLSTLEEKFKESPYLSSEEVIALSRKLQLADIRVKIWFQNRRARERRERNGDVKLKEERPILERIANITADDGTFEDPMKIHFSNDETAKNPESSEASQNSEIFPTQTKSFHLYNNTSLHLSRHMNVLLQNSFSSSCLLSNGISYSPNLNFVNNNNINKES